MDDIKKVEVVKVLEEIMVAAFILIEDGVPHDAVSLVTDLANARWQVELVDRMEKPKQTEAEVIEFKRKD
jgi:hypothetical protein